MFSVSLRNLFTSIASCPTEYNQLCELVNQSMNLSIIHTIRRCLVRCCFCCCCCCYCCRCRAISHWQAAHNYCNDSNECDDRTDANRSPWHADRLGCLFVVCCLNWTLAVCVPVSVCMPDLAASHVQLCLIVYLQQQQLLLLPRRR